uniref:Obg-like ATPase 1-like n=1 Tax=Saccoglossus kowalevskii TaxID=10224 RepID=A0ABM0N0R2_SACKO|nr:PREDICTED: obg-like ATPase 1-like [Saccoglossus kowalevskii]
MPPKKKEAPTSKPLIGRVGTSLKCGIVGLPNVGKSTFFNVLTKSQAAAENFPFCTIEPNESNKIPAFLKVVDIAGLVKGAHEGQGLGNAFLSNIKACDAIFHMTRAFDDDEVTHIEGDINPVRDMEIIFDELRLKDIEYLQDRIADLEKKVLRGADKAKKPEYECLLKIRTILEEEKKPIRFADWTGNEIELLNKHLLLTSKPMIYLINLSEKDFLRKKNKWLVKIKEWIDANDPGAIAIPFSGIYEYSILDKDTNEEKEAFMKEKGAQGEFGDERKGTKAPQAAGRVHGDFEKGFIMAEVMKYVDFKAEGSEAAAKAAGKYRQQGRNYVVEDGDIVLFKANTAAGLTDKKKK